MASISISWSQRTLEKDTPRRLSPSRENSRRWSRSQGIYRSHVSPRPIPRILWVFLARVGRSKGKKRGDKEGGVDGGERSASYASGGPTRGPACKLCSLRKMSGQRARSGMNIIQLVIRGWTSLSPLDWALRTLWASHTPYGLCGLCEARVTGVPLFQFCAQ